ncbi:probable ubiquitin-conjugating enzyme E2 23 isoform X3 [Physcomitrium patens]|uniref:probable ubiquitin-conjugating enzyme E2 23 isoform X3 n=1 Tax=Physcomitrium patens TaxID=3218 RepID=UPI003CCCC697
MEMLAGPAGRPQPETQLIREDLVQKVSNPKEIGIVAEISGDSTSTSNMAITCEDVDGENTCNPSGSARIVWLRSQETEENVTDLRVLDRSFVLGDVVATSANPDGQTGIVTEISMSVDLELPSGEVVEGIDSRRLRRVRSYMPRDFVIGPGNWLGQIEQVIDNVTVMFEGGAKCKIFRADTERLFPVKGGLMDDTNSPYYPGQRVRVATSGVFKDAKWLKGTWNPNKTEGASAGAQPSAAPAMFQKPSALLQLMYISHTNWQLGDWPLLPPGFDAMEHAVAAGEEGVPLDQYFNGCAPAGRGSPLDSDNYQDITPRTVLNKDLIFNTLNVHEEKLIKKQTKIARKERRAAMKRERGAEHAALVVKTKTKVDVKWQDGTKSYGVEASALVPVEYLGDHEFWPEQYVLDRGSDGEGTDQLERRVGVMKSIDAMQRTGVVRWLRHTGTFENPLEFEFEENVSVYEIVEHPYFNFCLGDVVMRLTMNKPEVEPSNFSKDFEQESAPWSEREVEAARVGETEAEQEIGSVDQLDVASGKCIEGPKKGKWPRRKRGRVGRRSHCDRPTVDTSWVGNVIGLKDGEIQVVWADGNISKVGPADVFVVNNEDEEALLEASESQIMYGDDALTWASLENDEEVEVGQNSFTLISDQSPHAICQTSNFEVKELCKTMSSHAVSIQNITAVQDDGSAKCSPRQDRGTLAVCKKLFSRMADALRVMNPRSTNLVFIPGTLCCSNLDEVLDTHRTLVGPNSLTSANNDANQNFGNEDFSFKIDSSHKMEYNILANAAGAKCTHFLKSSAMQLQIDSQLAGLHPVLASDIYSGCSLEPSIQPELVHEGTQEPPERFKQFDCVCGVADHHFVNLSCPNPQRKWTKKIQAEWAILEENLPDSIYVRVCEDRMDLLRAAIVGAQATPYHDGLFIFDIHLSEEFPHVPPVVYYHSGGLRLNPNLYENGSVCLSLLNTWRGKGTEVWDASNSSILQLLVSIQGLVLNATPYYNEADYEKQIGLPEGERNSLMYNENALLLSCKSMLYLLHRPPQHFEFLIRQHFEERGPSILKICAAYMNGALVGSLNNDLQPEADDSSFKMKSTLGFRIVLGKLLIKLTAEFTKLDGRSNLLALDPPHVSEFLQPCEIDP